MEGAIVCTHSDLREVNFGDQFGFICDGCRKMGYGTCYTCSNASCDYHLHSACKTAPPTISHPFFANQGIFVLEKTILAPPPPPPPPSPYYSSYNPHNYYSHQGLQANFMCVACGTSVAHGWRYVLMSVNGVRSNVFLHPCCMTLPHQNLVQPMLENHPYLYNNNNNVPIHAYTMTQEGGLGGQERRSNDSIVLDTLNSLTDVLGVVNNMGLFNQNFW